MANVRLLQNLNQHVRNNTWKEQITVEKHISTLVHAYECTQNNATKYGQYFLMYGWKPWLPINYKINHK